MNFIFPLFEYTATVVEHVMFYMVIRCVYHECRKPYPRYAEVILALLGAGIISVFNSISLFSYFSIVFFVLFISLTVLSLYRIPYIISLSIASFYTMCMLFYDVFIVSGFGYFFGGQYTIDTAMTFGNLRLMMISITQIGWIALFLCFRKWISRIQIAHNHGKRLMLLSVLGMIGFAYIIYETLRDFDASLYTVSLIILILIALFLYGSALLMERNKEQQRAAMYALQHRLTEEKYAAVQTMYETNARLFHDVNHHLRVLQQLLREARYDEAIQYIDEISEPIRNLSGSMWTGISAIDAIINSMFTRMKECGIVYQADICYPADTAIRSSDMCTILSNLLENAMDGTRDTAQPSVRLSIQQIQQMLVIKVSNPCRADLRVSDKLPKSSKGDAALHGWGLKNVEEAAKRYHGATQYLVDDGIFSAIVTLNLTK